MLENADQKTAELPYAAFALLAAVILMTPFVTFQTDFVQLPITLLLAAAGLLLWSMRRYPQPRWLWWTLIGCSAISALTLLVTRQWYASVVALMWMWAMVLLWLLFSSWLQLSGWRKGSVILLAATQLFLATPGIWTFFRSWQRATGFVFNANGLGGALLWGAMGGLICVLAGKYKRWAWPLWAVIMIAWAMTISLTAYLAAIVPAIIGAWWYRKTIPWKKLLITAIVATGGIAAVWFGWHPTKLVNLMTNQHAKTSVTQRIEFDRVAIAMWREKPLTGWGLGTYQQTFPRFTNQFLEQPLYVHNTYLQVLAETGIFGAIAWLALVIIIGRMGWRAVKTSDGHDKLFLQALWLGWLAFSIHAAVDFSWYFPAGLIWWVFASAIFVVRYKPAAVLPRRPLTVAVFVLISLCLFVVASVELAALRASDRGLTAKLDNDDAGAITELSGAIKLTGNTIDAATIAEVYWLRRQGSDLTDGEAALRGSIRRNPDDYFLWDGLGINLVAQKRPDEAVLAFAQAYALEPLFHPQFSYDYINALSKAGRIEEARDVLRRVLTKYGNGQTANPIILRQLPILESLKTELLPGG